MNRVILIFLTALALVSAVSAADDKATDALIQKAVSAADLMRGDVPFALHASFQIMNVKNIPVGEYEIKFLSPRDWSESITTAGYSESTVVKDGWMWKTRPQQYDLLFIRALRAALDPVKDFQGMPKKEIEKSWDEKVARIPVSCARYKGQKNVYELCADAATGHLLRVKARGVDIILSNHADIGGKSVPRSIRAKWYDREAVTVSIESVQSPKAAEQVLLPATGKKAPYCASARFTVPFIQEFGKVNPGYPEEARRNRVQGPVQLAVLIHADGTVSPIAVLESAGKSLDDVSIQAIRQWKYVPASCNGTPIDYEEIIRVNFEVRGY